MIGRGGCRAAAESWAWEKDQRLAARKRFAAGFVVTVLEPADEPFGELEIESSRYIPQCLRQAGIEAVDILEHFVAEPELQARSGLIRNPGALAIPVARMDSAAVGKLIENRVRRISRSLD